MLHIEGFDRAAALTPGGREIPITDWRGDLPPTAIIIQWRRRGGDVVAISLRRDIAAQAYTQLLARPGTMWLEITGARRVQPGAFDGAPDGAPDGDGVDLRVYVARAGNPGEIIADLHAYGVYPNGVDWTVHEQLLAVPPSWGRNGRNTAYVPPTDPTR